MGVSRSFDDGTCLRGPDHHKKDSQSDPKVVEEHPHVLGLFDSPRSFLPMVDPFSKSITSRLGPR